MAPDTASLLLTVYYLCCLATSRSGLVDAACSPVFPPEESGVTGAQAAGGQGLQVLVPSYNFSCGGVVTRLRIRADSDRGGDDGFVFQIWRPRGDGTYGLRQSVDTSGSTQREGNFLTFNTSIPVLNGDTIGYRLQPVPTGEQMHFLLESSNASRNVTILTRMTPDLACRISPCDDLFTMRPGFSPFITVDFEPGDTADSGEEGGEMECQPVEVTPCTASDPPSSISRTPSSDPSGGEGEGDTLINLNLTKETVIVLAIGAVLFLVLVVLVVVLVACVFHRRRPRQFRFKSPPTGQ
jgi:hypothetical protein